MLALLVGLAFTLAAMPTPSSAAEVKVQRLIFGSAGFD